MIKRQNHNTNTIRLQKNQFHSSYNPYNNSYCSKSSHRPQNTDKPSEVSQHLSKRHKMTAQKGQWRSQNSPSSGSIQKQNLKFNENTPKHLQITRMIEEVDQLSQIKFISKECSTIKEKQSQGMASYSNTDQRLDQFSGLFDEPYSKDSHDFQIQICGIQDSQSQFPIQDSSRHQARSPRPSPRMGKIKKNMTSALISLSGSVQQNATLNLQQQICSIFQSLDSNSLGILCRNNCCNQRLSTEMNYLIGSLINRIKVMDREYRLAEFTNEFMVLLEDSEREQLNQILRGNKKKKEKQLQDNSRNSQSRQTSTSGVQSNQQQQRQQYNLAKGLNKSKPNILDDKLNQINAKLNIYLAKNDLLNGISLQPPATDYSQLNRPQKGQRLGLRAKGGPLMANDSGWSNGNLGNEYGAMGYDCASESKMVQVSFGNEVQMIRGCQGSSFELNFLELNRHLY